MDKATYDTESKTKTKKKWLDDYKTLEGSSKASNWLTKAPVDPPVFLVSWW